ncbi:hypothetical protein [uncultured Tyzzerella sp.]|uniref:hypothetical protein n=1 Tax=uncultured Tyzzerella sp. TaxID=2321398 RepID=UPI002942D987|nr:hypothetical protein [uncultured Tyzzerella sp.]
MDNHKFYLVSLKDKNILKYKDIYKYLLDIDKNKINNGFKDINVIDKVFIDDDFLQTLYNFLIFIPNDTPEELQLKSSFGLNYFGITVLKNYKIIYQIFNSLYNIFEQSQDYMYTCINKSIKLLDKETYLKITNDNFNLQNNYKKIYKKDILYILNKIKEFSLKLKEDNFFIIHLGI